MNPQMPSILVVDDEIDACRNLQDILSDMGYQVDVATDAASALRLVHARPYDAVLLDLKMPDVDGLTLYEQIRNQRAEMAAIVVTAFASPEMTQQAFDLGVNQVLSKPIEIPVLLREIGHALDQPLLLVVDDDKDLCQNLWDLLRSRHFRVALAHGVDEAATQLRDRHFHVVLIDLKLAQGSGEDVLRLVQTVSPDTKTMLITGHRADVSNSLLASMHRDDVCFKPLDVPRLLKRVDELTCPPTL